MVAHSAVMALCSAGAETAAAKSGVRVRFSETEPLAWVGCACGSGLNNQISAAHAMKSRGMIRGVCELGFVDFMESGNLGLMRLLSMPRLENATHQDQGITKG
jgi:hypothetical protein